MGFPLSSDFRRIQEALLKEDIKQNPSSFIMECLCKHSIPDIPVRRSFTDHVHLSLQEVLKIMH